MIEPDSSQAQQTLQPVEGIQPSVVPSPAFAVNDRAAWQAHWVAQGQSWRTDPEIDVKRQVFLAKRRTLVPDTHLGLYPFKDVVLNRADVEWLLATHEDGRGPVDWSDESQRTRQGLDLRGADLRREDLQNLPLARIQGNIAWLDSPDLTLEQRTMAAVLLTGADLKGAHLEGSELGYAQLERADLRSVHLERASLGGANLEGAFLRKANLEGATLMGTHLDSAILWSARMVGTRLRNAHLEGATLDGIVLADENGIGPQMADIRWGDVNIAVVDWSQIHILRDEYEARQKTQNGQPKNEARRLREYEVAVRANRQVAIMLQAQGLNEDSSRFAYRAQKLQRQVLWRQGKFLQYIFSGFLDALAGYGYQPGRSLIAYLLVIGLFATFYATLGRSVTPHISPLGALVFSVTSFHGRGFFPGGIPLDHPITLLAAMEAIIGLIIEISFIATFTQRFFGK